MDTYRVAATYTAIAAACESLLKMVITHVARTVTLTIASPVATGSTQDQPEHISTNSLLLAAMVTNLSYKKTTDLSTVITVGRTSILPRQVYMRAKWVVTFEFVRNAQPAIKATA